MTFIVKSNNELKRMENLDDLPDEFRRRLHEGEFGLSFLERYSGPVQGQNQVLRNLTLPEGIYQNEYCSNICSIFTKN